MYVHTIDCKLINI